jgi:hypothetical protein
MNEIQLREYCLEQAIKFYAGKAVARSEIFSLADEIYDWIYLRGFTSGKDVEFKIEGRKTIKINKFNP